MQFGKKCFVRYTISALLHRPMLPDSLCPQVEYHVSLLEYIDIQQSQFRVPQQKTAEVFVSNQKCIVKASTPRIGFTRGDIIPLKLDLFHFTPCSRKKCIKVELVRHLEIRTSRHTVTKETVLKSTEDDMTLDYTLQQTLCCQILIPTSTPPSIRYMDRLLRFQYKIKVSVSFTENSNCSLILPIVIGTWPRASIPIDDEPLEDDMSLDIQSLSITEDPVGRSNSVKSYNSISSYNSWADNRTTITTLSSPASFPSRVPTHVLEPISSAPMVHYNSSSTEQEEESDSDEEDDLLTILKKKKKREQRELKMSQVV
ncbi:unnamed protein product [Rhizopus stolonifer]